MNTFRFGLRTRFLVVCSLSAALLPGADPALTIYNQNFAVIRETLPLDLKTGNNTVQFSGPTTQLEPDSVVLRDVAGVRQIQVVEQNYRNDAVSEGRLLNLFEGKTISFALPGRNADGSLNTVNGRIVRSGYVPHYQATFRYGAQYAANQANMAQGAGQPIIEVNGQLQFALPGQPIFPALGDDTILKPSLDWILYSARPARFDAELSYISGGLSWNADYNIIAPESGDTMDLSGWVTLDNQSGKQFDQARIKLMAGDVNKVQPGNGPQIMLRASAGAINTNAPVTEKAFEDYHLYTLPQPTTLHDRETKQVEFLNAAGVVAKSVYIYDGAQFPVNYGYQDLRQNQQYGTESNPHVWIMREFANSDANHLGVPLPKGRVRFYRRDQDGQVEFTGENEIDHTPKDEMVRVYTGNAFDITGERRQTQFQSQFGNGGWLDEAFEIHLRNHKKEAVSVRVVEHLYRWTNWAITQESAAHRQTDSKTIEYEVTLKPGEDRALTYTAHYTW